MDGNRICLIRFDYPAVRLTRAKRGTRGKYRSKMYYPSGASWNRLTQIINDRIKESGVEFEYIDTAEVVI